MLFALAAPTLHLQRLVSAARAATFGVVLIAAVGGGRALAQDPAQIREAQAVAEEAYVYGFPMIVGYDVLYEYFIDRSSGQFKAPINTIN